MQVMSFKGSSKLSKIVFQILLAWNLGMVFSDAIDHRLCRRRDRKKKRNLSPLLSLVNQNPPVCLHSLHTESFM